jgi:hypothetical protein
MVRLSSDPSHLELGLCAALADGFELVLPEAAQLVFGEASFAEEGCEDEREDGVAVVVLAVDLLAALCQPALQLPQCGWLMNLRGPVLSFPDDCLQLPPERQIEGAAGDGLLRWRPLHLPQPSGGRGLFGWPCSDAPCGILPRPVSPESIVHSPKSAPGPASQNSAMLAHGVDYDTPPLKGLRMQPNRLQMGSCRNGVTCGVDDKRTNNSE